MEFAGFGRAGSLAAIMRRGVVASFDRKLEACKAASAEAPKCDRQETQGLCN